MNKVFIKNVFVLLTIIFLVIPVKADFYINIPKYNYIVNYYIDEVSENTFLGSVEGSEYLNRKIDIDFNYYILEGYTYTGPTNYYVIADNMVIDIVYSKKTNLSYCVNYFYDGIISVNDTECYYDQMHGTEINFFIDKPKEGYIYSGFEPIVILDIEENIMNVYYVKEETIEKYPIINSIIKYIYSIFNKFINLITTLE